MLCVLVRTDTRYHPDIRHLSHKETHIRTGLQPTQNKYAESQRNKHTTAHTHCTCGLPKRDALSRINSPAEISLCLCHGKFKWNECMYEIKLWWHWFFAIIMFLIELIVMFEMGVMQEWRIKRNEVNVIYHDRNCFNQRCSSSESM